MSGKGRFWVWFVMIFVFGALSLYLDSKYFPELFSSFWFHLITFIPGVVLMWFVMRVSRTTGRTLAKYGREGDIPRFETNRLVDKGPYAYMRHPMHLGLLFAPVAWGLILGSPFFMLVFAPLEVFFILLMIQLIEEPEARKKFGEEYDEYIKDKPWFCLKPECLKELLKDKIE